MPKVPKHAVEEPEEDYDIVPHKRLVELEQQVSHIQKNPFGAVPSGKEMVEGMRALNRNLHDLTGLFKDAAEEMKTEQHDLELVEKQMGPVLHKLEMILDQNRKIAKGIIAIADMLKDHGQKIHEVHRSTAGRSPLGPSPEAPPGHINPLPPGDIPPPMGFAPPPGGAPMGPPGMMPPPRGAGMGQPKPGRVPPFAPPPRPKR